MKNSTDILRYLEEMAEAQGNRSDMPIAHLAEVSGLNINSLISILTELEQRDEIVMELTAHGKSGDSLMIDGTVRLMKSPPDEALNS